MHDFNGFSATIFDWLIVEIVRFDIIPVAFDPYGMKSTKEPGGCGSLFAHHSCYLAQFSRVCQVSTMC